MKILFLRIKILYLFLFDCDRNPIFSVSFYENVYNLMNDPEPQKIIKEIWPDKQ